MKKIKVLIVDDSAVVRQTLAAILNSDPDIEVIATASNPYIAASKIQIQVPDVITLDIEMPRMDGLTFLKKIMSQHPIPVVIISSHSVEGGEIALKALEYGAVEVITKPSINTKRFLEESSIKLIDVVKAASIAQLKKLPGVRQTTQEKTTKNLVKKQIAFTVPPKHSADVILPKPKIYPQITTERIIAVGASTGGTEAIRKFLQALPPDAPGVVIVQHMPEHFTYSFAKRLNDICPNISVKEAEDGDIVKKGHAFIAPGNKHMLLKRRNREYYLNIVDGPLVNRHRPSVDVLFRSVAAAAGKNAVGIIMTGMGDDGAKCMVEMKEAGARNAAQDEATCVVYGMPAKAVEYGAVHKILPIDKLADFALNPYI